MKVGLDTPKTFLITLTQDELDQLSQDRGSCVTARKAGVSFVVQSEPMAQPEE